MLSSFLACLSSAKWIDNYTALCTEQKQKKKKKDDGEGRKGFKKKPYAIVSQKQT